MYLKFLLISKSEDGFYHYEIYPDGNEKDTQTIIFNPSTKEIRKNTFNNTNEKYLGKFLQHVKDENGNYRNELSFGWG